MACDPISLANAGCWNCLTPNQKMTAELVLLCQILQVLDPMATCDPIALAGDGCANCLTPFQKQTAIYSLICSVYESIGTALDCSTCALYGTGDPNGVVTATPGRIYVQTDAPGVIWSKVTGVGNTGWAINS